MNDKGQSYIHLTRPCRQCGANMVAIHFDYNDNGNLEEIETQGMCGPCWHVWDFYNLDLFIEYDEDEAYPDD